PHEGIGDSIADAQNRTSGSVVEQGVGVESGHDLGLEGCEHRRGRGPGAQAGVDPPLEGDYERGILHLRPLMQLIERHPAGMAASAISASRVTCSAKPSKPLVSRPMLPPT